MIRASTTKAAAAAAAWRQTKEVDGKRKYRNKQGSRGNPVL